MKRVWLAGALAGILFAGIEWYLAPLEPGPLALQLAFSPRSFGAIVHLWSPAQLARYRAHFPADIALLVCYGAFGWLLATRTRLLRGRSRAFRWWAAWALPAAALCNLVQDAFHLWLTELPRFGIGWAYAASASAAAAKWALLFAYALSIVYALARAQD